MAELMQALGIQRPGNLPGPWGLPAQQDTWVERLHKGTWPQSEEGYLGGWAPEPPLVGVL